MENRETSLELYEDKERKEKVNEHVNKYSRYCDFIYYESSITPGLVLAMRVLKPEKPSYILASTHGWHMSIRDFVEMDKPASEYLTLQVDMRGRAFSDGEPDCNGYELYDIIDACEYAKKHYSEYIADTEVVYFEAGSGGGGNSYAVVSKFPDYFAAASAMCGISDYGIWYDNDHVGEFRDEMDVWIKPKNAGYDEAYASRSGITAVENLLTPLAITHGEMDIRVPVYHARNYIEAARKCGKTDLITYMELKGKGGQDHWTNATDEDKREMEIFREKNRKEHRHPITIPRKGKMKVCGYLVTKEFSVFCDSLDRVGNIMYNLDEESFEYIGNGDVKILRHHESYLTK